MTDANEEQKPLSEDDLAAIRERWLGHEASTVDRWLQESLHRGLPYPVYYNRQHVHDIHTLLAEVERLKAGRDALREIAEAMALRAKLIQHLPPDGPDLLTCQWCSAASHTARSFTHTPDCPVTKARTLLGYLS